jgi:ATP-binding cassette subfamily B protein AbcA/BmrA
MKNQSLLIDDKGAIKRFFRMLQKARLPYLWLMVYIIISAVLSNVGISVTEYTAKMFAGYVGFVTIILPFLIFQLLSMIIGSISGILSGLCVARIDRNFRYMVWTKIVRLPLTFYDKNDPKELISRITTDISSVSGLIMRVFLPIVTTGYTILITIKKIGSYDRQLMLTLIVTLPFNILIAFIVGKLKFGISDKVNRKNAVLTQTIAERTNQAMLIKSFTNEEKEYETGKQKIEELYNTNMMNTWVTSLTTPMYTVVGMMQFIVIVMVGRGFYSNGALSLLEWIAYFGFANSIVNILTSYCGYWTTLKNSQGATNRIAGIMEMLEEEHQKGEQVEAFSGDIKLENITYSYGEKMVLKDTSLTLPAGKITAIIGPSGSGKTTILNLIDRLYPWESGKITIGGKDITQYGLQSYRESLAYVTQENVMLSGTIRENLLFGIHHPVEEEELNRVCRLAFIEEFIASLPERYETRVGEDGSTLSGGQKQRIAFARALLKKPEYLLMDEATAAMDMNAKDNIWEGIAQVMKNKTVITVAHDKQTVLKADYIVVIEKGKVIDAGTRDEMKAHCTYFQELLGEK